MKKGKHVLLGLLGALSLILAWGLLEPYLIDTEEEVAEIPNLPNAWEGQRIALISDWQVGMWLDNTVTIRRIVEQLVKERPALVLISGDFIYRPGRNPSQEINQVIELVHPLIEANIPTYAVLGNHDYGLAMGAKNQQLASQLHESLEAVGVQVLKNEAVSLSLPDKSVKRSYPGGNHSVAKMQEDLYLVGIGSHLANEDKPAVALSQVPQGAPRLVMMHNPDSFAALPPHTAPLAVAGHTHGGQIRLPFLPEWSWLALTSNEEVHVDGWISGYGQPGNQLYINRGIGFSHIPIRLNCPPEVTLFTLASVEIGGRNLKRKNGSGDINEAETSTIPLSVRKS